MGASFGKKQKTNDSDIADETGNSKDIGIVKSFFIPSIYIYQNKINNLTFDFRTSVRYY